MKTLETRSQHLSGKAGKPIRKKAIRAPEALSEAYRYPKPSSFSRALRIDLKTIAIFDSDRMV